jgi:hypothetical protein
MNKRALDQAKRSVVKVGGGRGFVIEGKWDRRMIVTTAHCLPSFPPCRSFSCAEERTYQDLLGPLNGPTAVWTECLFVDPISDLAVLGPPDSQDLSDKYRNYEALVGSHRTIKIAPAKTEEGAWLLSLANAWGKCTSVQNDGPLWLSDAVDGIHAGMSGSPVVRGDGRAIGVVCASGGGEGTMHTQGGPNPRLEFDLPGWLLRQIELGDG